MNKSHLSYKLLFKILFGIINSVIFYLSLNIKIIWVCLLLCNLDISTDFLKTIKRWEIVLTSIYLALVILEPELQCHQGTCYKYILNYTPGPTESGTLSHCVKPCPKASQKFGLFSHVRQWMSLLFKTVVLKHCSTLESPDEFFKSLSSQAASY